MERCECVEKWMLEVKEKYGAYDVCSDIPWKMECLGIRKIITPRGYFEQDNKPRVSKHRRWLESKNFKFCPHCGKKFPLTRKEVTDGN